MIIKRALDLEKENTKEVCKFCDDNFKFWAAEISGSISSDNIHYCLSCGRKLNEGGKTMMIKERIPFLKDLYQQAILIKYAKPMGYMDQLREVQKRIKEEERVAGGTDEELDKVFNEASAELRDTLGIGG